MTEVECAFCDRTTLAISDLTDWVEIELRLLSNGYLRRSVLACPSCASRVEGLLQKEQER
ncbi:MAG: hypothetical protein IT371_30415 [Deltaproteobacteria bacterium]|nr:hypothetical protein [Deltaproteobacteria bacterium]